MSWHGFQSFEKRGNVPCDGSRIFFTLAACPTREPFEPKPQENLGFLNVLRIRISQDSAARPTNFGFRDTANLPHQGVCGNRHGEPMVNPPSSA
jgi:hypothetical protein